MKNSAKGMGEGKAVLAAPLYMTAPVVVPSKAKIMRIVSFGAMKRLFDLVASGVMLIVLSPLFAVVAVAVKLDSPGPVFFRQKRTGKRGKEFEILKFRSMVTENDMRDLSCEDKYTKLGEKLRKSSIDELPQLINVFKGEMSFIGPRPWVPEYWENMNERERERCKVRPGITGLAAAKGRNGLNVFEKIGYDLEYVQNYSLSQDVKVVFLTIKTVLSRKEADAGKRQVHDDIEDLKKENKKHKIKARGVSESKGKVRK